MTRLLGEAKKYLSDKTLFDPIF